MSKSITILYKIKDFSNYASLYTLCCSLILPYITYCVEVYEIASITNTNPIFILQNDRTNEPTVY